MGNVGGARGDNPFARGGKRSRENTTRGRTQKEMKQPKMVSTLIGVQGVCQRGQAGDSGTGDDQKKWLRRTVTPTERGSGMGNRKARKKKANGARPAEQTKQSKR